MNSCLSCLPLRLRLGPNSTNREKRPATPPKRAFRAFGRADHTASDMGVKRKIASIRAVLPEFGTFLDSEPKRYSDLRDGTMHRVRENRRFAACAARFRGGTPGGVRYGRPPMTSRSEFFTTASLAGLRLHALHWGEEKPARLVLLHGGGANAHWWDHLAPQLAESFHVIALDFRGHGDSDYPEELVVGAFNDDLEALLEHLGSGTVALLGHSMGGGVALDHAAHHHDVAALVAVDVSRGASKRSRRGARLALALRRSYETRDEAIRRYRFLPASAHASEELRLHIASHSILKEDDGRFGFKFDPRWFSVASRPRPDLGDIRCPTLLVRGAESPMLTVEGADELIGEFQDGRAVVIDEAGHHVQLDQPEAFLAEVSRFLRGILDTHASGGNP